MGRSLGLDKKDEESKVKGSFLKKRTKKLLFVWCREFWAPGAQIYKVFLLLFVHKKKSFLA
jgi:hypothetical protein